MRKPWLCRKFWIGFHLSTAIITSILAFSSHTTVPWKIWASFALITMFFSWRYYLAWNEDSDIWEKMCRDRRTVEEQEELDE